MRLFDRFRKRASDAVTGVVEPIQDVSNAVLIGGMVAGVLVGGAYLYSKIKKKQD